jgi:hypothetical protein
MFYWRKTTGWKILHMEDGVIFSGHTRIQMWVPGEWYSVPGRIKLCHNGFHCSPTIPEANAYIGWGMVLARVEGAGKRKSQTKENRKQAFRHMRIVRAWEITLEDRRFLYSQEAMEERLPGMKDIYPG